VEIWEEGTLRRLDLPSPGRDGICAVELPGDGPALVRFPELLDEAGGWRIRVVPIED
jgi:hypothetical protein